MCGKNQTIFKKAHCPSSVFFDFNFFDFIVKENTDIMHPNKSNAHHSDEF